MRSISSPKNSIRTAVLFVCGLQFDGVAVDAETAAGEIEVVSRVLHINETANDIVTLVPRPAFKHEDEGGVLIGCAQAVDAGDGGDDDYIPALPQGFCGSVAQAVNFIVDLGVFFDVGVRAGNVGFRLVVVVVGDEVLDGVVGEEVAETPSPAARRGFCCGR